MRNVRPDIYHDSSNHLNFNFLNINLSLILRKHDPADQVFVTTNNLCPTSSSEIVKRDTSGMSPSWICQVRLYLLHVFHGAHWKGESRRLRRKERRAISRCSEIILHSTWFSYSFTLLFLLETDSNILLVPAFDTDTTKGRKAFVLQLPRYDARFSRENVHVAYRKFCVQNYPILNTRTHAHIHTYRVILRRHTLASVTYN